MTKPIDAVEQTATDFEQAEAALLPGALSALTDSVFTKLTPSAVNAAIPVSGDVIAITGTDGNDLLLGTNGDDTISGLGGDDTIFGINGNDQISGGQGADFIDGGAGDDTIFGDEGNDRLIGGDGFDNIVGGAGDDSIEGDAGDDRLTGGDGNDTLNGGDGNDLFFNNTSGFDIMLGGAGDDTFDMAFGQPGDAIGGDGFDTVTYRGNTAEGAFVVINLLDELQNAGSAAGVGFSSIEDFILSPGSDTFIGDDTANIVEAGNGDDSIFGGGGDDQLFGDTSGRGGPDGFGAGNDLLDGGDGNDSLDGGAGNDTLIGGNGDDHLFGGDTIIRHPGQIFPGGDDSLSGGAGNDTLDGGDGDDVLDGGAGADILTGGDGFDTASYLDATAGVTIDLTRGSAEWTGDAQADVFDSIERISLTNFSDLLIGDANANFVLGGSGDDRLIGGGGDDGLTGGNGNDILEGGDGNDNLRGDGFAASPGNDILFGNAGDDVLVGDAGGDSLNGGAGADVLDGGDGFDFANYSDATAAVSIDMTQASSTWTGDAQGDTFTSIEAFDLTAFNDVFHGDDADNKILGRDGDDQLFGGGGNDTLVGDFGNDVLSGGLGADVLISGDGADIFKYTAVEESQNVVINGITQIDDITDFTQGQDKIDLSAIDANPNMAGDQAFTFLADPANHTGDWSGLVWSVTDSSGHTMIFVSTDADADPEMEIYTPNPTHFNAGDFIL